MSASSAMQDLPVSRAEFAALLSKIRVAEDAPLAVAVSGGADSLALLALLADLRKKGLFALSVDHGLRAAAKDEARHVARVARRLGVPHMILRHRGAGFSGQAAARDVRFDLLASWCRRNQVRYCALAHHRSDQAETFLFRLARGSGLAGLAAMSAERVYAGCHFIRPLLDLPPERLKAVLTRAAISWRDDPSNRDPAYSRTHLGHALDELAAQGIDAARLARASQGAARLKAMISEAVEDFLRREAEFVAGGYCWLSRAALHALPPLFGELVLGHILQRIGGRVFRPKAAKLAQLHTQLYRGLDKGRTLAGCRIVPRGARLLIFREFAAIGPPVHLRAGAQAVWDRRFYVRVSIDSAGAGAQRHPSERFEVAPLGFEAVSTEINTDIPPLVRPCLPALWQSGHLISVPHLGIAPARLEVSSF